MNTFENKFNDIYQNISKNNISYIELYFGKYTPQFGSYNLSKLEFDNLKNKLNKKSQPVNKQFNIYKYYDMILEKSDITNIYSLKNIYSEIISSNWFLISYNKQSISPENFPLINNYHDNYLLNMDIFTINNYQIIFSTEIYQSETIYSVKIKFDVNNLINKNLFNLLTIFS